MLRIEFVEAPSSATTLRLQGRVIGPWVDELQRVCERVLASGAALTLDLGDVSFVDRGGVRLLRGLTNRDVTLLNGSGFVGEQLKAEER